MMADITDCGDEGCEDCDVCRYLNFLEWAQSVGRPNGSTIERNDKIEAYLAVKYPAKVDRSPEGQDGEAGLVHESAVPEAFANPGGHHANK